MNQPDHTWLAVLVLIYALVLLVGVPVWAWLSGRLERGEW